MSEVIGRETAHLRHDDPRPIALRLWDRWAVLKPFAVAAAISIVVGGSLAAAIAAPAPTRHGVWAVAFLVLVLGVGQLVIGVGLTLLSPAEPHLGLVTAVAAAYNVAGVAIMLGIVTEHPIVFDVGSTVLLIALLLLLNEVRNSVQRGWLLAVYRLMIGVLVVSIPIGAVLTTIGPH